MFRPTGFADLAGKRVGVFGYGVEGHATERRLRGQSDLVLVDDDPAGDANVLATNTGGLAALLGCDVVLKSPGISAYRDDVLTLKASGVLVTSALNLWLQETNRGRVVGITGTKGKSTTTALIVFMLQSLGEEARAVGNIGQPPYDVDIDTTSGWSIVEISSFQCVDIEIAPGIVVVTSLGADHLDWHGSLERYRSDKLSLTRAGGHHDTIVPDSSTFRALADELGGDVHFVGADETTLASTLNLLGEHSNSNVALALDVVARLTHRPMNQIRHVVSEQASTFRPLRGRLTLVDVEIREGVELRYVDDGLATSALPVVAALDVFVNRDVALIAGGFDRGVDYGELAAALAQRVRSTHLFVMGEAGLRIADALSTHEHNVRVLSVADVRNAVAGARSALSNGGVVLFSPGAPSFDHYKNWEERSDDFVTSVKELVTNT